MGLLRRTWTMRTRPLSSVLERLVQLIPTMPLVAWLLPNVTHRPAQQIHMFPRPTPPRCTVLLQHAPLTKALVAIREQHARSTPVLLRRTWTMMTRPLSSVLERLVQLIPTMPLVAIRE